MTDDRFQGYDDFKEAVRDASDLIEVASEYTKLTRKGRCAMGLSPFRQEKDGSFACYDDGRWHDFGTGESGDVFALIMRIKECSFPEAIDILAKRRGLSFGNGVSLDRETRKELDRINERRRVKILQTEYASYCHQNLTERARSHMRDNYGLTDESIAELLIGWANGEAAKHFLDKGWTKENLLETGNFIRVGKKIYELHEERITMPYLKKGFAPYMISRRLEGITPNDDWQKAKYKKTIVKSDKHPYVSKYVRNDVFWGEDTVRFHRDKAILNEGITDAMAAWQLGYAILSFVTVRPKRDDIEHMSNCCGNVDVLYIVFDNERPRLDPRTGKMIQPGLDGALETAKILSAKSHNVRIGIIPLPDGADKIDLNEYLKTHTKEEFEKEVLEKAKALPQFMIDRIPKDITPEETDNELFPIYEVLAKYKPALRERYIAIICKKFSLTKATVRTALAEFLRKELKVVDGGDGGSDGGGDKSSSGSSRLAPEDGNDILFQGAILEGNGFYYVWKGENLSRISNFTLTPNYMARTQSGKRFCCDVKVMDGQVFKNVLLPERTFRSSKDFRAAIHNLCSDECTWSGKDDQVQGIVENLKQYRIKSYTGVPTIGYTFNSEGEPRWIDSDKVYGPNGEIEDSELVYTPVIQAAPVTEQIDMTGMYISKSELKKRCQKIFPLVFTLNEPDVILPALGWFSAAAARPAFQKELSHFPSLWNWGTQGSGKTSIIKDVFWPLLHGIVAEPSSCSDTNFAQLNSQSSSTSIADFLDEFKPIEMNVNTRNTLCKRLRGNYSGENERRGRPDLKLVGYRLVRPVVIAGEMGPDDPALRERMIPVLPNKNSLTTPRRKVMMEIMSSKVVVIAGGFIKWILGQDIKEYIEEARVQMKSFSALANVDIMPRVFDNLLVLTAGDLLNIEFCEEMRVDLSNRPKLRAHIGTILANITESSEDGVVKDSLDLFLEELVVLNHEGAIVEGQHYAHVEGEIRFYLEACYKTYLAQVRQTGQRDVTNGKISLRRQAKENMQSNRYVTHMSRQTRLGKGNPRCVCVDAARLNGLLGLEFSSDDPRYRGNPQLRMVPQEEEKKSE